MPIVLYCKNCKKKLRVPDSAAGKRGQCDSCKTTMTIPAQSEEEPVVVMKSVDEPETISPKQAALELEKTATAQPPGATVPTQDSGKKPPANTQQAFMGLLGFGVICYLLYSFIVAPMFKAATNIVTAPSSKDVAVKFVKGWMASRDKVVSDLDGRSTSAMKDLIRSVEVHSFNEQVEYLGEETITIRATGDQISCDAYECSPVMKIDGYAPVKTKISVARDTNKVYFVHIDLKN